jgi:hypothetical protein
MAFCFQSLCLLVLNAFRHHRSFRLNPLLTQLFDLMCSTPFGITDPFASDDRASGAIRFECSTPFGITDPFAKNFCQTFSVLRECSTPFGITDPFAAALQCLVFRHHSAPLRLTGGMLVLVLLGPPDYGPGALVWFRTDHGRYQPILSPSCPGGADVVRPHRQS